MRAMMRALGRLRRQEGGATAVEFALAGMVFLVAVLGVMEVGMIGATQVLMEHAVRDASRVGVTGANQEERLAAIRRIMGDRTLGLVDMDAADIEVLSYEAFDQVGAPEPFEDGEPHDGVYDASETYTDVNGNGQWDADQGRQGAGRSGEVVLYRITYDAPSFTGVLDDTLFSDGAIRLTARVVVRNEPFDIRDGGD